MLLIAPLFSLSRPMIQQLPTSPATRDLKSPNSKGKYTFALSPEMMKSLNVRGSQWSFHVRAVPSADADFRTMMPAELSAVVGHGFVPVSIADIVSYPRIRASFAPPAPGPLSLTLR